MIDAGIVRRVPLDDDLQQGYPWKFYDLTEATGLAQIEQVSDAVRERAEQFEEREEALRARFEAAAE
jgi:hypothetical protein